MKISLFTVASLLLNQNFVEALSKRNTDEIFEERDEFWTRELGKSTSIVPAPPTKKPTIRVRPTRKPITPPTNMPTLRIPPTNMPTLRIPPTSMPTLRIPPTSMPTLRIPPTSMPTLRIPQTETPMFRVPPTQAPGFRIPPTSAPGFRVPPTQSPGFRVPPTNNPAFRIPPTESPVIGSIPTVRVPPTAASVPDTAVDDSPIIIITPDMGTGYSGLVSEQDVGCGFTSAQMKAQGFADTISAVSDVSALADMNSPQSKAIAWMSSNQGICPSDANVLQKYVLGVLYFATNGEGWTDQLGFLSSANECDWTGIECDSSGKVTSIAISGNNLSGVIPNEIGSLDSLSSISLTQGNLAGPIPDSLYDLPLTELELSDNSLSGDLSLKLYNMTSLETLHLNNNQFTGEIEAEIANLQNLVSLKLNDNQFKSRMKRELKDMLNLEVAQFHNNNLYGKVPSRMCNLFLPRFNGKLKILTADCATLDPVLGTPKVACECCTQCY